MITFADSSKRHLRDDGIAGAASCQLLPVVTLTVQPLAHRDEVSRALLPRKNRALCSSMVLMPLERA
jgi:hypothetical protein